MPALVTWLLLALGAYWVGVLWNRWRVWRRTRQFVLEQRRKAGIADSDQRPLAVAAADAALRRKHAFEQQLQQSEDIFGPAQSLPPNTQLAARAPAPGAARLPVRPAKVPAPSRPGPSEGASAPRKRHHAESDPAPPKRSRTASERPYPYKRSADDVNEHAYLPHKQRRTDQADDVHSDGSSMSTDDDSDRSQPDMSSEVSEMDEDDELVPGDEAHAPTAAKRGADTSYDHGPGDEWRDANGLRWRIADDGIPRRLVTLVEMRQKYKMPKDATHTDSRAKVPTYVEKFLSHDEYKDAKRKKQLSWQHELALAQNSAASSPLHAISNDPVEDSLASLRARRSMAQLRRSTAQELLHNEATRTPQQLARSRASSVLGDSSFGTSVSGHSGDDRSFSSSLSVSMADTSNPTSRRLALGRSPATGGARGASPTPGSLRAPRFSRLHAASPSPLSPARATLDQAAKRKREEQLMTQIRANRTSRLGGKEADAAAPSPVPASSTAAPPAPEKPAAPAPPVFTFGK